ncbi:MAG: DNA polymerase/3'-5' exonuclease PolX, partial [Phycisphaerae bacterium]|nr:DNA polymerase/3'-5' exonuclease PolX [Phycisphaerae bacterium]
MENAQIAKTFEEIADLLELQDANEFRIRSYRETARTIRDQSHRMEDMVRADKDLTSMPSIGDSTAEKIEEVVETGTCKRLEEEREKMPDGFVQVMKVPDVGPKKTAMQLHEDLGIESLDDLEEACENGTVVELDGMGEKTHSATLEGIQTLWQTHGRILLQEAEEHVESLRRRLNAVEAIDRWAVAGSYRRGKETVGDLDILVEASDRKAAADAISDCDAISKVDSRGRERVTVHLDSGLQVDFRFVDAKAFGAAMLYFTGSKAHNIALRRIARDHDWTLNEYGLFKGGNLLAGNEEQALYHRLGLAWVCPEMREDR